MMRVVQQTPLLWNYISVAFLIFLFKLNIPVVGNLISKKQIMNGTFDKLRYCSTYGAFGMVAERREELIIESSNISKVNGKSIISMSNPVTFNVGHDLLVHIMRD
jgi:hypothetical protein